MKRVVLGMSGGTDSSVAAMLLQEAGYEVLGVTFRFYEKDDDTSYLDEAVQLAQRLGITHRVVDMRSEFEQEIINYFVDEYMAGRTPVPCTLCNNRFKWRLLLAIADEEGIEYVATGHYVQKRQVGSNYYIIQGEDSDKDQSFFLWGMSNNLLKRALFPLGSYTKTTVREIAAHRGEQRVATKKDSMGVCFCPGDYRSFLATRVASDAIESGRFLDSSGKVLGKHRGYPYYTVGQRRKLEGIQFRHPMFVKEIDPIANTVTVAPLAEMYKSTMILTDVNIIDWNDFASDKEVTCKIRYRKQETPCTVTPQPNGRVEVYFHTPVNSIATGQAAVFYSNDSVLGGGIIDACY